MPSSDLPDPTAKSGSSEGESGGDEGAKDSEGARKEAGDRLKKAGDKIAKAGEKLGSSGSTGKEDELAEEDSENGDDGDGNGDDPLSEDVLAAQEALREALEDAGIALEEAGELLENAATEEEMMAAAEALARARVVVIVTAEELERVLEAEGEDADDDPLYDEAREALYDANLAIVIGGDSLHILDGLPDLPGESDESEEDKGRINDLESELDEALVVFDSTIQDARGKVMQPGAPPASPQIGTMPGKVPTQKSDAPTAADAPGAGGSGNSKPQEVASASLPSSPDDLPSAQDDDIVAKQLREAAVAESDPELRDKLWDEYRRYKEGSAN